MSLLFEECGNGVGSVPILRCDSCRLGEVSDVGGHGGCLWMVQVLNVAMWMVHGKVLVKKDRVEQYPEFI